MNANDTILATITAITRISNNSKINFNDKLQQILMAVVNCMRIERGSIMIMKGKKNLEVVASTHPVIIGVRQPIEKDTPSSWVVKNKKLLYFDERSGSHTFSGSFKNYKKSSFLLVPILAHNRVFGVLSVTEKIDSDSFSKEEQEMVLNFAGQVIGALENHRLTEILRKNKLTLEKKNKELKKLEKIRTELFNMLIHDLKGPISEIVANLDILSYTVAEADSENIDYVQAARIGCDTLFRMVSDLLDIARLEEGSLNLIYEKLEPDDLIKEALSRLHGLSGVKQIRLVENLQKRKSELFLSSDRRVLLRVLQNLLTNAIHYSPSEETVEAGYDYTGNKSITFFVKDNGPGVPPKYQKAIFEKYFQVDKKNDGRIYTTGLGLTFCKLAVEAHKGTISVESDGKKGSCFKFTLPLKQREE